MDECIFVFRHQIAEYFFHIDEEHGGVRVNLGHRRNGPWFEFILNEFRWRCHLAPRHADNPIDVSYMERLHIAIVFGHNEMIGFAVLPVKIRQTQHLPKIDHRQRRPRTDSRPSMRASVSGRRVRTGKENTSRTLNTLMP